MEDKAGSKVNKKQSVTSGGGGVPMSRKLTTAMKRLVVSETEEQYRREEMSWQMAELIITEVKKIKLGKPNL